MYAYCYVSLHTYIHTNIHDIGKSMIMLMNAKWDSVPTSLSACLPRSYDVGTTSLPFLLRWYYVNPDLTTLSRGPHHTLTSTLLLRKC